jgi:hypothetical protein
MSYSFRLPEEDPVCECKYDEAHDRMDREDCPFHYDLADDEEPAVDGEYPEHARGNPRGPFLP